jgi:hypothetical protein
MNRSAMIQWLRAAPLFSELSPAEIEALATAARSVSARKHARLFEEGSQYANSAASASHHAFMRENCLAS